MRSFYLFNKLAICVYAWIPPVYIVCSLAQSHICTVYPASDLVSQEERVQVSTD